MKQQEHVTHEPYLRFFSLNQHPCPDKMVLCTIPVVLGGVVGGDELCTGVEVVTLGPATFMAGHHDTVSDISDTVATQASGQHSSCVLLVCHTMYVCMILAPSKSETDSIPSLFSFCAWHSINKDILSTDAHNMRTFNGRWTMQRCTGLHLLN